jgi:hypothetical protein
MTETTHLHGYLLAKAQDQTRLALISEELNPVKELRDNIGLLHMLIERRFNMMKNDNDLILACGPITTMIDKMEKLVSSCHKIEQNLGLLLAKQAILNLAKNMVAVMIEELEGIPDYEDTIDRITTRLYDTIRGSDQSTNQPDQPPTITLPPIE